MKNTRRLRPASQSSEVDVSKPPSASRYGSKTTSGDAVAPSVRAQGSLKAQQALAAARDRYRDLFMFAPIGYVTIDSHRRIREVNHVAENLLQRSRRQLLGEYFDEFLHANHRSRFLKNLAAILWGSGGESCDVQFSCPNGELVDVRVQIARDDGAEEGVPPAAARIAIVDMRERVKIEQLLRESEQKLSSLNEQLSNECARKDEFLAMLAHELRNPLAAIGTAARLRATATPEQLTWAWSVVERQVNHLTRLIDDLLDVSRISRGKLELRPKVLDIRSSVENAVATVRCTQLFRGQRFEVWLGDEPLYVLGDPTRIEQIFANLVSNALKYGNEDALVRISASVNDGIAEISISDNGIGIAPDMLPKVFELFVQAASGGERSRGGLGIGLALTKRLLALHGGDIVAQSEGVGKGATFTVRLPLTHSPPLPEEFPRGKPEPQESLRVLLVEDNADAAEGMQALLELEGYQVRLTFSGEDALEVAGEYRPDVVLLDIGLPGIDGYAVAEELRRRESLRDVHIVALSGYGREQDREQTRRAGFDAHLIKPVDFEELLQTLSDVTQRVPLRLGTHRGGRGGAFYSNEQPFPAV